MFLTRCTVSFRGRYYSKSKFATFTASLHNTVQARSTLRNVNETQISLSTIRTKLIQAVNHDHMGDILQYYGSIKRVSGRDMSIVLSLNDFQYMLRTLLGSANKEKISFCMRLVEDAIFYFRMQIDAESLYTKILDASIAARQMEMAYDFILDPPGTFRPSRKHFLDVMTFYGMSGDVERLRKCLDALLHHEHTPTVAEYALLIDATFRKEGSLSESDFLPIFDEMHQLELPFDGKVVKLLRRRSASLRTGSLSGPQLIMQYQKQCIQPIPKALMDDWFHNVRAILAEKGTNATIRELERLQERGLMADSRTLTAISSSATTLEQMRALEYALGVRAGIVSWTNLIKNVLHIRGLSHALTIYEEAKSSGVKPDWIMVYPLLRALCQSSVKDVTEDNLEQALSIYHDVDRSVPEFYIAQNASVEPREASPQVKVYNVLLHALTSQPRRGKYYHTAKELLADMFQQQVPPNSKTLISIAILLIRAAPDQSEAYAAYRHVRKVIGHTWDERSWTSILNAFCERDFDLKGDLLVQNYFDVISDMKESGHPMEQETYGILFKRYAKIATALQSLPDPSARSQSQSVLEAAIRRTHDMLILDSSITPSVFLWNQLMDAYNRLGAFANTLHLWNALYVSGQFNQVSVSIIIDACAFAGAYMNALSIWTNLNESSFKLNYRNWNTWIECLCRLGRLDDAVKTACLEMSQQSDGIEPDEDIVIILLGFAMRSGRQEDVKIRIKKYLPKLWDSIPFQKKEKFYF